MVGFNLTVDKLIYDQETHSAGYVGYNRQKNLSKFIYYKISCRFI